MEQKLFTYQFETHLPVSLEEAFKWHMNPYVFERISPPFINLEIFPNNQTLHEGQEVYFNWNLIGNAGLSSVHKITELKENEYFIDEQVKGIFSSFKHKHQFIEVDENNCKILEQIEYKVHLESFLGDLTHKSVQKKFDRIFKYRERVLQNDLLFKKEFHNKKLHILISGSTGLIGSKLCNFLKLMGHFVTPLKRNIQSSDSGVFWDVKNQKIDLEQIEDYDAVIHLAGENISGYWSKEKKEAIYDSRIESTKLLAKSFNQLKNPPKTFICASGCNYYQEDVECTEEGPEGKGFLHDVIKDWEYEADQANCDRIIHMRTGVVLSPKGGMLKKILPVFKTCLGGRTGSNNQHFSWISIDDVIYQYYSVLMNDSFNGAVNLTSPLPVTNEIFSKTLAKVLKRPCIFNLPSSLLSSLFGDMAKETVLKSLNIIPKKLIEAQSKFHFSSLEDCLRHLLGLTE